VVDIYEKSIDFLYNYFDNFLITILIVAIINNLVIKFFEAYLEIGLKQIKNFNDFIKTKEESIKINANDKKIRRQSVFSLHEKYSYNPIFQFIYIIPFIIQIPFLLGVYFALDNYEGFKGISLFFINDLSQSDNVFFGFNLLPILMLTINLIVIKLEYKTLKLQTIFFPFLFLIILYDAPSSLILYWTLSLIISPIIYRFLKIHFISFIVLHNSKIIFFIEHFLKSILSKYRVTFFALFGPYFLFLINNDFRNSYLITLCFFIVIALDLFLKRKLTYINIFIFTLLYSMILYYDTLYIIHNMRIRHFLFIFTITTFIFFILVHRFKLEYYVNIFLLILLISFSFSSFESRIDKDSNLDKISLSNSSPPLVLLILDGISSSDEIYHVTKDSSAYNYENILSDLKFENETSFKSLTSRTKFSLPSIFNFNLHTISSDLLSLENKNENERIHNKYLRFFKDNALVDSLLNKGVRSYSFGLVKFKNGLNPSKNYPWENFYFYNFLNTETNFFRRFFYPTIINIVFNLEISDHYIDDYQRKSVLDNLINFKPIYGNFYYFHLKMPHPPYTFFEEFISPPKGNELEIHIAYKNFLLEKITPALKSDKFKNTRIIITGDHGFRSETQNLLDPYKTVLYTKGINSNDLNQIMSVQDLGFLINNSF